MTRDPRRHPQPGDVLERGHILVRVVDVANGRVVRQTVGMPGEVQSVALAQWRRLMQDARVVACETRDGAPSNGATKPADPGETCYPEGAASAPQAAERPDTSHRDLKPVNVLPRDLEALRLLATAPCDASGWTEEGAAELRARAELERRGWQGLVTRASAAGLLERRRAGARKGDRYRLTDRGRMALAAGPPGAARGRMGGPHGDVLGFSLPPNPRGEKNNEPTNEEPEPGPHGDERGRMAGPHGAPTDLALVVMDRLAAAMERLADVLALRALPTPPRPPAPRPAPPAAGDEPERSPPSSDPRPVPDHPVPECCGSPRVLTNGPKGWFWGCVLWRSSGCRGLSLDEARAAWLEAQRAAAVERRREEERAERERERLRALNDDRPSLLSDPAQLDRIIRASSRQA